MEPLTTILAFLVNDTFPDLQICPEMDNSVKQHAAEKRQGSYWSLEPVVSGALHMEPLSFFSLNDSLPVFPNFSQNEQLGLGTRYGDDIRIIL